jgi:crossover junction endodeoxyribonuclease RuvC
MVQLLRPYADGRAHAVIEEAQAMPGQGVRSMFTIGVGFGVWLGLLATLDIPYTRVRPSVWKPSMGLRGQDKEAARLRAQQLFPQADLRHKRDHGKAEALLLAEYGRRAIGHGQPVGAP